MAACVSQYANCCCRAPSDAKLWASTRMKPVSSARSRTALGGVFAPCNNGTVSIALKKIGHANLLMQGLCGGWVPGIGGLVGRRNVIAAGIGVHSNVAVTRQAVSTA